MPRLVLGSRNKKKLGELVDLLGDLDIELTDLSPYPDAPEVEETETTFEANARLKASTLAPVLGEAAKWIATRLPEAQFLVARAPHLDDALFEPLSSHRLIEGRTDDVLSVSDVVLTASGTATVQSAVHGKPMVVLYRLSPLTYTLGKPLAKVQMYAMVNLIAGRRVVAELIQDACTPDAVAGEAVSLLVDHEKRERMVRELVAIKDALGGPGASARAADAVLDLIRSRSQQLR